MRPFETLALILTALSLLPLFLPVSHRTRRLRWLPLSAILALLLHLFREGYRWQMLPAYVLVLALNVHTLLTLIRSQPVLRTRGLRAAAALFGLVWLAFAVALPLLLPVPRPLPPTGPYGVGTTAVHIVDAGRPEPFSTEVEHRELMVQIWYPALISPDSPRAPYVEGTDVVGPAIASRFGLPSFLLGHLDLVRTAAYLDAPATTDGPFPLLVFSHGLRGLRVQNTSLMQQLASHGYVVAAVDHPYANLLTVFPEERVVFYDHQAVMPPEMTVTQAGTRLIDVWAHDIAFVVQQLAQWSQTPDHPLRGHLDPTRLGLLGHSTGGGAAVQACAALPQCDAALALDGWIEPLAPQILQDPYRPTLMLISAPDWLGAGNRALGERLYRQRQGDGYLLTVAGTVHFDYTDIPLMSPLTPFIGFSGDVDGPRVVTLVNDYALAFFDQALKQQPFPLLLGPSAAYPEVTFAP